VEEHVVHFAIPMDGEHFKLLLIHQQQGVSVPQEHVCDVTQTHLFPLELLVFYLVLDHEISFLINGYNFFVGVVEGEVREIDFVPVSNHFQVFLKNFFVAMGVSDNLNKVVLVYDF